MYFVLLFFILLIYPFLFIPPHFKSEIKPLFNFNSSLAVKRKGAGAVHKRIRKEVEKKKESNEKKNRHRIGNNYRVVSALGS